MSARPTTRQIAAALLQLLESGEKSEHVAEAAASYLITERRSHEHDAITHDMLELRAAQGTVEAVATSAYKLSDTVRRELKFIMSEQFQPGNRVVLSEVHSPALVGGVKLEAPGVQLDLSIKHRLQQLTATMQSER